MGPKPTKHNLDGISKLNAISAELGPLPTGQLACGDFTAAPITRETKLAFNFGDRDEGLDDLLARYREELLAPFDEIALSVPFRGEAAMALMEALRKARGE